MLNFFKKIANGCMEFAMKALPVIIPALLIINANSVASSYNRQPETPKDIKKYRKF